MSWWNFGRNLSKQLMLDRDVRRVAEKHKLPVKLPSFWSRLRAGLQQQQQSKKKGS